jgi:uncharacterized protein
LVVGLTAIAAVYAILTWMASSRFIRVRGFLPRGDEGTPGLLAIEARTEDGLLLRGSFLEPAREPRGVVILFHGIGNERFRGALNQVAGWGFLALSFDFRGHGSSDGDVCTFGWDERKDVLAIVGAARARWPGRKIGAWGVSLGGAALCYAAEVTRGLDAVVLESVYRDIDSAFEKRVTTVAPAWAVPFAVPTKWLVAKRLGIEPELLRPVERVGALRAERVLITTGEKDVWAGPDDLAALAAALPGCTTEIVPAARHHDLWVVGGEAYATRVRAFFEARLR